MQEPDPETLRRAQGRDLAAFEDIVRACQADVWRFARSLLHDRHLAEDVTQESFLRAYRFLPSFRGDSRFSTWLFRIVRNCAADAMRKIRPPGPGLGLAPLSDAVARAEIDEALAGLAPSLREAFLLVEVFGLRYADAARVLDTREGTVKSRVHRARTALAAALTEEEDEDAL